MEKLYGHRTSGIFGYSHLTGGFEGGQSEYARVPIADMNCLKVPSHLPDEKVLFLSDIVCTGFHANELGEVKEGDVVAVWGCGPVGLMTQMWAKYRGAKRIIAIDAVPSRLQLAREKLGSETINFGETDVIEKMHEICPGGPDVCIDAVGFRFPKSLLHKFERFVKLETDAPQVLEEAIILCKKNGIVSAIGDYYSYANHYPVGAQMMKGVTVRGSQVFVQKYWKQLLDIIDKGGVDPTFVITHTMPLDKATEAYKMFDSHDALKIILKPGGQMM